MNMTGYFLLATPIAALAMGTRTHDTTLGFLVLAGGLVITGIARQVELYLKWHDQN